LNNDTGYGDGSGSDAYAEDYLLFLFDSFSVEHIFRQLGDHSGQSVVAPRGKYQPSLVRQKNCRTEQDYRAGDNSAENNPAVMVWAMTAGQAAG
jgi:hypothetical protein